MKRSERHSFRLVYAAWLLGICAFFVPAATWNPVSRFDLTRAIVERQTFSIDAYVSSTGDRALCRGQWYSDKAPMPSLLAVPAYGVIRSLQAFRGARPQYRAFSELNTPAVRLVPNAAFQQGLYACSLFVAGGAGVAIGLLLFELLRRRTSSSLAFAASSAAVLGTPILTYSTSFYGHVPAGAALLGALVALDERGERPGGAGLSAWRVRLGGLCLALAPGCEYITAFPAALLGLWFLLRTPRARWLGTIANLALGAAAPVLLVATYHSFTFGAPWRTGYSFIARPEFAAGHAQGMLGINLPRWPAVVGLTVGTRRGLFFISPFLAFGAVAGTFRAVRTRDWTILVGLAMFLLLLLMNAGYYMWWGGASAGPRHLIPAIAILSAGIATARYGRRRWVRPLIAVLVVVSIANCVALALIGPEAPETGNIVTDYLWPALRAGRVGSSNGATNIGVRLGLGGALSSLPLLGWLALGYWYLGRWVAPRRPQASSMNPLHHARR